ncbi:hypothetical protein X899_2463 [Burkholderia pseudomallei TSV 25]|uniref:hypothetical protein n=2 Tax=Burkholderia pseudomallei TaxID=28450 RepID=UPI00050F8413|nr:hypothetical protein [Burkholderia pseudomallei]AIV48201.1 hypothetical protein X988_2096 [Burkholderia pseudomallei TSV 48]KGC28007.1 hypothetical protein DO64_2844 [Burkholderia pseudomallei]KGV74125.1 hypothetical protein X890_925 [Burkholderia pseudomallei MSHR4299]KGW06308.1 hypothetical protein X899_2463 [Burkholderia pseudomallei TSV 25]KGW90016.1 hypothetical protein Y048_3069 [Burkholderia pseudomallei MSHR456]
MDENLIPERRPLPHLIDAEINAAFERTFAGTRDHVDGRPVRTNPLHGAFGDAGRAMPPIYQQGNGTEAKFIRMPGEAATGVRLNLADFISNTIQDDNVYTTNTKQAGETHVVDPVAEISARSVAVQAGVRLVLAHPRDNALVVAGEKTSGLYGLYRDSALVRRTLPANFADVADGAAAASQALPFQDKEYGWPDAPSAAFSTTVTRAMDKAVGGGETLWACMLDAILGGLAQYVDRVFFAALAATNPTAFSFNKVAAQFLQESDIRAVTNGTGAGYRGDGVFSVQGVPAMLSAQAGAPYIFAPGTCVAALWHDVDIKISRLNTQGDAQVTCFASAQGIVPDANVVWTAA